MFDLGPLFACLLPAGAPWSACAIGAAQLPINTYCILAGELQRPVATPDAARAVLGVRARSPRQGIDAWALWPVARAGRSGGIG